MSYLFSLIFSFSLIKLQNNQHKNLVNKTQNSRIDLGKSFLSFWDNVVLGNTYNFKFWNKITNERITESVKNHITASAFRELVSIAISLVTFLPSVFIVIYGMYRNIGDSIALAAFLVIMPRLFLILSYTYNLLYLMLQFGAVKSRVKTILKVIQPQEIGLPNTFIPRIDWDSIQLHSSDQLNGDDTSLDLIKNMANKPTRLTIRGKKWKRKNLSPA